MPKQFQNATAQFRTSSHQLKIETGRHQNIPAEQRLCDYCNSSDIDDEVHMLIKCEYHDIERRSFFSSLPSIMQSDIISDSNRFRSVMTSKDKEIVYKLAYFIHKCFQKRKQINN